MALDFLSDIELYYTPLENVYGNLLKISGDEKKHIIQVMRHNIGDKIYATDGHGHIYICSINEISRDEIILNIAETLNYPNQYRNIYFCIPKLKNSDRFEFALEKSIELGITNFIIFTAEHSIAKGDKTTRISKLAISAMKQSLRSYRPEFTFAGSITEIINLPGKKIILEQHASNRLGSMQINAAETYYFIFGPEGGLSDKEKNTLSEDNFFQLTGNRLRAETAIITTASLLCTK